MSFHLTEGEKITNVGFGAFKEKGFTKSRDIIIVISGLSEESCW